MGEGIRRRRRITVSLACSVCKSRNYKTTKTQRDGTPALELKKFCKVCNKHTKHREER